MPGLEVGRVSSEDLPSRAMAGSSRPTGKSKPQPKRVPKSAGSAPLRAVGKSTVKNRGPRKRSPGTGRRRSRSPRRQIPKVLLSVESLSASVAQLLELAVAYDARQRSVDLDEFDLGLVDKIVRANRCLADVVNAMNEIAVLRNYFRSAVQVSTLLATVSGWLEDPTTAAAIEGDEECVTEAYLRNRVGAEFLFAGVPLPEAALRDVMTYSSFSKVAPPDEAKAKLRRGTKDALSLRKRLARCLASHKVVDFELDALFKIGNAAAGRVQRSGYVGTRDQARMLALARWARPEAMARFALTAIIGDHAPGLLDDAIAGFESALRKRSAELRGRLRELNKPKTL